jgi:tetratricopeptide (TPR) repeat protein
LEIRKRLATENPTVTEYQRDLATSYSNLGLFQRELGDWEAALASSRQALLIFEKLTTDCPAVAEHQRGLADTCNNLGLFQTETGDFDAALANYRRAQSLWEKLVVENPDIEEYALNLGGNHCNLGNLLRDSGRPAEAVESFSRAAGAVEGILECDQSHTVARQFLRNTYWGRAQALGQLGRHDEAAGDWQRSAELDDGSRHLQICLGHGDALARAGDHARAAALVGELTAIDQPPAELVYNLACILSLCATVVKDNATLADQYAARALELLKRSQAAGFFNDATNIDHLGKDTDLDALRERDDFRKFMDELPKAPPKSQE